MIDLALMWRARLHFLSSTKVERVMLMALLGMYLLLTRSIGRNGKQSSLVAA